MCKRQDYLTYSVWLAGLKYTTTAKTIDALSD